MGSLQSWITGKNTTKESSTSNVNQSTTPIENPLYSGLEGSLIQQALTRLTGSTGPAINAYETSGIQGINKTFGLTDQSLQNRLASMGLSTSPVAANAGATMEAGRSGQIAGLETSLPTVQRQMQDEDFTNALNLFNTRRTGTQTTGTTNSTGTSTTQGPGIFGDLVSGLGFAYGAGLFKK